MAEFVHKIDVGTDTADTLKRLIARFPPAYRRDHRSAALMEAERLGSICAELSTVGQEIAALIQHKSEHIAVLLRTDSVFLRDILRTPAIHPQPDEHLLQDLDVARMILIGAGGGFSYAYKNQANGNICDDVMPISEYSSRTGHSQGVEIGWHTEDAAFNYDHVNTAFDVLSLAFFRNPYNDPTYVSVPDVSRLSESTRRQLETHQFAPRINYTQLGAGNSVEQLISLIYFENGSQFLRFSFARFEEERASYVQSGQAEWIDELISELDRSAFAIPVEPGDILFVDNMRAVHARRLLKHPAKFDGSDRWHRRLGCSRLSRMGEILDFKIAENEGRILDNDKLLDAINRGGR